MQWIPLWQWTSWTPAERGEVAKYYDSLNVRWGIDLNSAKPPDLVKDHEEYIEEMSQGGKIYDPLA